MIGEVGDENKERWARRLARVQFVDARAAWDARLQKGARRFFPSFSSAHHLCLFQFNSFLSMFAV